MSISKKETPIKSELGAVFIHVRDLKRSVKWYSQLLGFDVDLDDVTSPVFNIPIHGTTGLTLDDHAFDENFKHVTSPNPIFNFVVEDIDQAYHFVKEKNAKVVREIERIGDNFAWFNFLDPDDNVLMACTY